MTEWEKILWASALLREKLEASAKEHAEATARRKDKLKIYYYSCDADGDILMEGARKTYTPKQESDHKPEGFTYVSDAEYNRKAITNPISGLSGWEIEVGITLNRKRNRIGGLFIHNKRSIKTHKFEEAIVLDWNGVPTINGIRYNMSKSNRLEPKYNNFHDNNNMDH